LGNLVLPERVVEGGVDLLTLDLERKSRREGRLGCAEVGREVSKVREERRKRFLPWERELSKMKWKSILRAKGSQGGEIESNRGRVKEGLAEKDGEVVAASGSVG
jgi:hypothetical protein